MIQRYLRVVEADPRETFAFRRLLDLYRERDGSIERLVADLTERVTADATAYAPRMLLGHVLRAQRHPAEAGAAYARAAELRPGEAAPRLALAQLAREGRRPLEARRYFDEALALTSDRLAREEILREVAAVAMEQEDYDGARGYFEQLARGGDGSLYLRTELARALAAARQWERAVAEYEAVLRSLRGDNRVLPPVLLELSRAQLESGAVEASLETLDRALRAAGAQAGIRAEIYDQMMVAYRRADRLPELAERLRTEGRGGFEASELLGRLEDELGSEERALEAYRRALRARSRDIDTRLRVIQLLTRSGRLDEVVAEYRALIRTAPGEPRFVMELAQLLVETDRRAEALTLLRDTGRRHGRDPALHQQLAELYARWGEDALAAAEIELLSRIDPREPAHWIALGAAQFDRNERDAALRTWRRIAEIDDDRARGQATLAGVLADHDLLSQAVEAYRAAVALDPDEISYARGLATTLERDRHDEEAEREWRRVLELAGEDRTARREARERIVGIWVRGRQVPARLRELRQRFEADPPDVEAGRYLAELHRRSGAAQAEQAERVLERIVESEPGDVESLLALERVRRTRGDLSGAIEALGRLRTADPRRASHYLEQMAEHALALYRDDEAAHYAAEAVEQNPDDASAHRRLADLHRARQRTADAIASYRRALELNDRLYPVYFDLAELHVSRGEMREADRQYRDLLAVSPDDDLVARAARASIQIHLGAGTLAELERDLLPLALANPRRPIFRRVLVELYDVYAGPLVLRVLRGGAGAEEARTALAQLGTRGIKPLLEALADADPTQRRVALDILGDLGNPSAAAPLLALAEGADGEIGQRMQALRAAGIVAREALVPRFAELATNGDRRLRPLATWGLSRIGGTEALRALARLHREGDEAVRPFAALGLGAAGDYAALGNLAGEARDEDTLYARTWALGRAGDRRHVPTLVGIVQAQAGPLAQVAAEGLGWLGGEGAEAALVEALFSESAALRGAAARGLARAASAATEARPLLPPPHPFERPRDYVQRIVEVGSAPSTSAGPVDLGGRLGRIEAAAARALGGSAEQAMAALAVLGDRPEGLGLGPLTAALSVWPTAARAEAEADLAELAVALVPALVGAAGHPDVSVRVQAVRLLARLDDPRAEAALVEALSARIGSVRRGALEGIVSSRNPPGPALTAQLARVLSEERDWSLRTRAAEALSRSSDEVARAALRTALDEDDYAFVREAAARGLRGSTDAADRAALEVAGARDPEPRVRAVARGTVPAERPASIH